MSSAEIRAITPRVSNDITGPAEIEISIRYTGDGMPSLDELRERQALERRLAETGCGEITDAGAGEGLLEIYLEVQDAAVALPIVEGLVAELGLSPRTTIEVNPLEEDD
jgi:hypothetical protein